MTNTRIASEIAETVAFLNGTPLFDIAEIAAQCDDTCAVRWDEDSEAYVIRAKDGSVLFLFDVSMGCIDAVAQ